MGIDITTDEGFLFAETQHREILAALNRVVSSLPKEQKGDDKAVQAIEDLGRKIEKFASIIISQEKTEKGDVKVELNPKEFVSSVTQMSNEIIRQLEDLKAIMQPMVAPKVWEFQIKRNQFSQFIESVKAIQK
jgi:hypothetical protein